MSEEKNEIIESEEVAEEIAEEIEEVSEENVKVEVITDDIPEQSAKKMLTNGVKSAIIACIITAVLLLLMVLFNPFKMKSVEKIQKALNIGNPATYADRYIDTTGRTAGEVAEEMGMAFGEFKVYYDLPEDLSEKVHENAAINSIPVKIYAEKQLNKSFEEAKEIYGWGDDVTKDMTIGEAFDKTALAKIYGEEQVENLKVLYNLDASVTGATLYGEVRHDLESRIKAEREAAEAVANETPEATGAVPAETAPTESAAEQQ